MLLCPNVICEALMKRFVNKLTQCGELVSNLFLVCFQPESPISCEQNMLYGL